MRRLLGVLAWIVLSFAVGLGRLGWLVLQLVVRPQVMLFLIGLSLAIGASPSPMTAQLPIEEVRSLGHVIAPWALAALGSIVFVSGAETPLVRRTRKHLFRMMR